MAANMKYVYGPVPSRRLGLSLGISPIPKKTCNYSCIYCQLGRTDHLTNTRQMFFPVEAILSELDSILAESVEFDVITIVGEGEPTLYLGLGELISQIRKRTDRPVAVITNGALLYDPDLRAELQLADIVLPSLDGYDQDSFRKINRPYGKIHFEQVLHGLEIFGEEYPGQIWIEIMLIAGVNDDDESLRKYSNLLKSIRYDRLYINTPVRPPAESDVQAIDAERMRRAIDILGGISIDHLVSQGFQSQISDDYLAILSIIQRHPMNQYEVEGFLESRGSEDIAVILERLKQDSKVASIYYKGYRTYRLK